MSKDEIQRYSHDFLMYLSSSPLVPKIELTSSISIDLKKKERVSSKGDLDSTELTKKKKKNVETEVSVDSKKKEKVSKKDQWVIEDEKFSFESNGMDAIQEFKLMMKSKETQPVEDNSVQKSRFLKFFDEKNKPIATTNAITSVASISQVSHVSQVAPMMEPVIDPRLNHIPEQIAQAPPSLTQEQHQFQRVMAMLARSSISAPDPQIYPSNFQPMYPTNYPSSRPVGPQMDYYRPMEYMPETKPNMGFRPSMEYPMTAPPVSPVSLEAPKVSPVSQVPLKATAAPDRVVADVIKSEPQKSAPVPVKRASYSESTSDPCTSLNAMLQSSIKAKKFQNNDVILQKLSFK